MTEGVFSFLCLCVFVNALSCHSEHGGAVEDGNPSGTRRIPSRRHRKNENSLLVCMSMILILFIHDLGKYFDCKYIDFCLCSVLFISMPT